MKYITPAHLQSFEIGNEPNSYPFNPVRPLPGTTGDENEYVREWHRVTGDLMGNFSELRSAPLFQGLAIASGVNQNVWNAATAFSGGIKKNNNIASVSYHHYQVADSRSAELGRDLMDHSKITTGLDIFQTPINYLQKNHPCVRFVLGEVNSALGDIPYIALEGVLGSALWSVNLMLYAMSIVSEPFSAMRGG